MTSKATITFAQTGVQPPVYVVTSLSDPPWEPLEMKVDNEQTASANLIFERHFTNVSEGSYQYKIRIGQDHWIIDETKDTATDDHGNRNNVIRVKPGTAVPEPTALPKSFDNRKDSGLDPVQPDQESSVPVPFVVVEKVADKEQPEYGDVEPESLPLDAAKRTADPDPDFEVVKEDSPVDVPPQKTPEVPLLVVEKTDDQPAYGDDFGQHATIAQKVAHEMRAADASPDKLIISPDFEDDTPPEEDQPSPLFSHESFHTESHTPAASMDTIDEESLADQTSSSEIINTPSDSEGARDEDELYRHVHRATTSEGSELGHEPLFPHEAGVDDLEHGEFDYGPLLPHETGFSERREDGSAGEDEFDRAPLLSHETGFSADKTKNGSQWSDSSEPRHYTPYSDDDESDRAQRFDLGRVPTFPHERDDEDDELGRSHDLAPLLSHEQDFAQAGKTSSEQASDYSPSGLSKRSSFSHETEESQELFGGNRRPNYFRARTNSSTLPHKLPQTDEDDENLRDPLLEKFPTQREQILERVASIGLQLPEDHAIEDTLHSPQLSVFSQACSSVDLVPVKSYVSLASVPEADDSDEDDGSVADSLPSPIALAGVRSFSSLRRERKSTSPSTSSKGPDGDGKKAETQNDRTANSSEGESANKTDSVKTGASTLKAFHDAISTPSKILSPITPPLTPERNVDKRNESTPAPPVLDSQLRQRREQSGPNDSQPDVSDDTPTERSEPPALSQTPAKRDRSFLHTLFGQLGLPR
ncbi:hypothetical protein IQ07DRAFT_513908 [Pyrenochaeta sp. DS3sAY3a]|nr:hypothetical protein IQ07DRAFT_513908 [Pyrenochaeta sp. DS3sAY3a]